MNLLQFTSRTAWAIYAIPVLFAYGTAQQIVDRELASAAIAFLSGLVLFLFALLKTAQHRRILDRRNTTNYVRQLIHNANTFPYTFPPEEGALIKVDEMFNNPLK